MVVMMQYYSVLHEMCSTSIAQRDLNEHIKIIRHIIYSRRESKISAQLKRMMLIPFSKIFISHSLGLILDFLLFFMLKTTPNILHIKLS